MISSIVVQSTGMTSETVTSDPTDYVSAIENKARDEITAYFEVRDRSNPWRGRKAALEESVAEYETRFLIELIQNGYDAIRGTTAGRMRVLLREDEGEHGVVYVANSGRPFRKSNFDAICEFAQSDKHPGESVGSKGMGFKSTLAVCSRPEIYSCAAGGSTTPFDGYCFRFAGDADVLAYVDGDSEAADDVMRDIGLYCIPVAVSPPDDIVREFGDDFATVMRLPLDDERSLNVVRTEVARLVTAEAPIQLFLAGLAEIQIETQSSETTERTVLTRAATVVSHPSADLVEHVDLAAGGKWLVATIDVPDDDLMTAMRASVEAKRLNPRWLDGWEGTAAVSAAVRLDDHEPVSRYYAYLPMGKESTPPFRGCVNAPFSAKLARTSVSGDVPLNRLFMDASARAAVAALEHVRADHEAYPAHVAVDLLAWEGDDADEFVTALSERDLDPLASPLVRAQQGGSGSSLAPLGRVYEWQRANAKVLTAKRVMACTDASFLSALTPGRLRSLDEFVRAVGRPEGLAPDCATLASWSELVAERLARNRFNPRTWEAFYADLAEEFSAEPEELRDRKLVMDNDGRLHRCAPRRDEDETPGPIVFFPPRESAGETDGDTVDVRMHGSLRRRIVFVNESIRWLDDSRRATPARQLFDSNRLIRPFDRRSLIEHIGRVMRSASSPNTFAEALAFAHELYRGRATARLDLRAARLRVSTRGGWRPAEQSHFPGSWHPSGEALERLIDLTAETCPEIAGLEPRLLVRPGDFPKPVTPEEWRPFLEAAGVRHGLEPRPLERRRAVYEARYIEPARLGRTLGLSPETVDVWTAAIQRAGDKRPEGTYKDYATRGNIWQIPGAEAYPRFDDETRVAFATVVINAAARWQDHHWTIEFHRPYQSWEPRAHWPSPLSAFLSETPWIPVIDPADRDVVAFARPRDAWHFQGSAREEPPTFVPIIRHDTRGLLDRHDIVLRRFRALGLRVWNDPTHTTDRLLLMGDIVAEHSVPQTSLSLRKAYRDTLVAAATADPVELLANREGPRHILVSRGDRLQALELDADEHEVYVAERSQRWTTRIVELMDVDAVWVDRSEKAVAAFLADSIAAPVLRASEASIELVVDGEPFVADAGDDRLLDGRDWLTTVVALTLDLKGSAFEHRSESATRAVLDRLSATRLRFAADVRLRVNDREIVLDTTLQRAYPHRDVTGPYLILHSGQADQMDIADVEALVPALADAIEVPSLSDPLRVALVDLGRVLPDAQSEPTAEMIAVALETTVAHVSQVQSDLQGRVRTLAYLLRPLLALWLGSEAAVALAESIQGAKDEAAVKEALEPHADELPLPPDDLIATCLRAGSLDQLQVELNLDFAAFNRVLIDLGSPYSPRRNAAGHEQALRWFVAGNLERMLGALRTHFRPVFDERGDLAEYVALKDHPGLHCDPDWLDLVPKPTEEMLSERVTAWLADHGVTEPLRAWPEALEDLQSRNRRFVEEEGSRVRRLIAAWTREHGAQFPPEMAEDEWAHRYAKSLGAGGWFDFDELTTDWLLATLVAASSWPAGMPVLADREALGLTDEDLADTRARDDDDKRRKERARRVVELDGREFLTEESALAALAQATQSSLGSGFLDSPLTPAALEPIPAKAPRGSSGGPGRPRSPREGLTDAQKRAIGLAGEVAAFEWLKRHYPGLTSAAWRSGYRDLLYADGAGNDDLGYDFEVTVERKTILYEVKSTRSAERLEFDLGVSEARAAQRAASHPRKTEYWILYIISVLDSPARMPHLLPNPFSPEGERLLREVGRGLSFQFSLAGN